MKRLIAVLRGQDRGMATAEYAVGTIAACGFAGVLYKILTSKAVEDVLVHVVKAALSVLF